jgi:acetyltransferase-like isoleucine patch superfamily enzyme
MGTTIICAERIEIGEHVMIGRNVTIRDNNGGHYLSQQGYKDTRPVIIGNHVWLCEGCTVMAGVKIGDGAIIGAHAVVYSNVPPFSLVSGNPAKVIETNIYWKY